MVSVPALRTVPCALALLAAALCAGRVALAGTGVARFASVDAARKTLSLSLVAAYDGANSGFNYDGYGRGMLLVRVPLGWRVSISCANGGSLRHSCAVVAGPQTLRPAFAGAATPAPVVGLLGGQRASFSFRASRTGSYRITSLVPGDEQARLWAELEVGGVTRPSLSTRAGF